MNIEHLDTGVAGYAHEWVSVEGLGPYDAVVPDLPGVSQRGRGRQATHLVVWGAFLVLEPAQDVDGGILVEDAATYNGLGA